MQLQHDLDIPPNGQESPPGLDLHISYWYFSPRGFGYPSLPIWHCMDCMHGCVLWAAVVPLKSVKDKTLAAFVVRPSPSVFCFFAFAAG